MTRIFFKLPLFIQSLLIWASIWGFIALISPDLGEW